MSKWLESLGFGAQKPKRKSSPAVARIRETMRWRGYDLSAYSDEEIEAARIELGDGVSDTGETTHASREALAARLKERRQRGISPESVAVPPAGAMSSEEPPVAQAPVEEPPAPAAPAPRWDEPISQGQPDRADSIGSVAPTEAQGPAQAAAALDATGAYKPAPGRYKSPLLLGLHGFGLHSWKYRDDPPGGPRMRCDGCGKERPAGRNARPTVVAPAPDAGEPSTWRAGDSARTGDESPQVRPEDARNAWSNDRSIDDPGLRSVPPPRPATPRPRQDSSGQPSLFQRFMGSPWWVKTVAIFFLLQVVGMLASLFSGGAS